METHEGEVCKRANLMRSRRGEISNGHPVLQFSNQSAGILSQGNKENLRIHVAYRYTSCSGDIERLKQGTMHQSRVKVVKC